MKTRLLQLLPAIVLAVLVSLTYLGRNCIIDLSCPWNPSIRSYSFDLVVPLYLFSLYALPGAILAIFTKKEIFKTWFRYSFFWALFSAILIYKIPVSSGYWLSFWWAEKHSIAQFCGILFSAIGLLVIGVKTIQLKRKKR